MKRQIDLWIKGNEGQYCWRKTFFYCSLSPQTITQIIWWKLGRGRTTQSRITGKESAGLFNFWCRIQVEAKKRLCLRPRSSDAVRISLAYSTSKDHNQMALDEQKHSLSKSSSKFFEEKIGACVHATKNVISRVKLASVTLQVLSKIFLPDPMVDQSSGLRGY